MVSIRHINEITLSLSENYRMIIVQIVTSKFDYQKTNIGAMIFSILTFYIKTLIIKGLFKVLGIIYTHGITTVSHYAKCYILFVVICDVLLGVVERPPPPMF
jgi:hypothetical protein